MKKKIIYRPEKYIGRKIGNMEIKGTIKIISIPYWKTVPKIILHKENNKWWSSTEFKTGMLIGKGFKTKKEALNDCMHKLTYIGEERFNQVVHENESIYGAANK